MKKKKLKNHEQIEIRNFGSKIQIVFRLCCRWEGRMEHNSVLNKHAEVSSAAQNLYSHKSKEHIPLWSAEIHYLTVREPT